MLAINREVVYRDVYQVTSFAAQIFDLAPELIAQLGGHSTMLWQRKVRLEKSRASGFLSLLMSLVVVMEVENGEAFADNEVSGGVCYVYTISDLPKYVIIRPYEEIYIAVGALNVLEDDLRTFLDEIGIHYEEEMFAFDNRCIFADESRSVSHLLDQIMNEFRFSGYEIIH